MKILQSSVFRAICAIAVGILLIKYPDNTVTWITVAIGVLFLLSGLISLIVYINARKNVSEYKIIDAEGRVVAGEKPTFPIVGVGSLILGFLLALTPNIFITALMYIIGGILILGAINQYKGRLRLLGVPVCHLADWSLCHHQAHGSCQYGDAHSGLVLAALWRDRINQFYQIPH